MTEKKKKPKKKTKGKKQDKAAVEGFDKIVGALAKVHRKRA